MARREHGALFGEPRLQLEQVAPAHLLQVGDGALLALERPAQLLDLRVDRRGPRLRRPPRRPRALGGVLRTHALELGHLLVDVRLQLGGVAFEDGDLLADGGDLEHVAHLEEVLLRGIDQAVGDDRIRPMQPDVDRALVEVGPDVELLLEEAGQRFQLLGLVGRRAEVAEEPILEAQDRGAPAGPFLQEIGLPDQGLEVLVADDHLHRRARRRVVHVGIGAHGEHRVLLREQLAVHLVRLGKHRERAGGQGDHGRGDRDEQPGPPADGAGGEDQVPAQLGPVEEVLVRDVLGEVAHRRPAIRAHRIFSPARSTRSWRG